MVHSASYRGLLGQFTEQIWMRSSAREVEDVPELLQHIQSRLPLTEAVRTSVLSKSWLHAWSTIPTLTFLVRAERFGKSMKLVDVDRTLIRYLRDNIPIETFNLVIDFENQESASLAEKWIRPVATTTCLKEFALTVRVYAASFTVPDEILLVGGGKKYPVWMTTSQHPVINCVSLQELHLDGVCISEEVLHDILSSCRMLVKIVLLESYSTALEVSDVPNLGVFSYDLHSLRLPLIPFNGHSISLGSSRVTQLMLGGMILDNVCLDTIKMGFPFLESLTIGMRSWMLESFHFTCASIKRLSLLSCPDTLIDVQVHAPNLLVFEFDGGTLPSLLFPASSLQVIRVSLLLHLPVDANFFLKMREALTLSRKCHLNITTLNYKPPLDIDIDDLRTRLPFLLLGTCDNYRFKRVAMNACGNDPHFLMHSLRFAIPVTYMQCQT
ncbi:hypothetical protein L1887_24152 [Cichorium endivia]|nr:hypothetical protein L1887_24152 [Cichorium endivia]